MKNPSVTAARAAIRFAAHDLSYGATLRVECPFCAGGRSREQSFYITRTDDSDKVLYVCHRASCGKRGAVRIDPSAPELARKVIKQPTIWEGNLIRQLPPGWLVRYYQACAGPDSVYPHVAGLSGNADDPDEAVWVLRDIHWARVGVQSRKDIPGGKRVRTFKESERPVYNYKGHNGTELWIVEDCLSAAGIASWSRSAVALLGTSLHPEVRSDLCYSRPSGFIVALDPGAEKAAALVRQQLSCYTTRPVHVLYMSKDFKNMTKQEQAETIERGRL